MAHLSDAGPESRITGNLRQLIDLLVADFRETLRGQGVARDIGNDTGEITDATGGIDDAGFLVAGRAETNQFHGKNPALG